MKKLITNAFLSILFCLDCSQSILPGQKLGVWMTDWQVCGPFQLQVVAESEFEFEHLPGFETDFLQSVGGETAGILETEQPVLFDGKEYRWKSYSAPDSIVNLDTAVSTLSHVAAYAYREFVSPQEIACFLSIGSNDGGRLWLNGVKIWDRPTPGGVIPDDELFPVVLQKGRNTLLVKVEERGNIWGFCTRLLPLSSNMRQRSFFRIVPENAAPVLTFRFHEEIIDPLFDHAQIQMCSADDSTRLVWEGAWTKTRQMRLDVDTTFYARYLLTFSALLPDGQVWREKLPFAAGQQQEFVLFDKGRTDYRIVLDKNASDSERWAAKELQYWLGQVSNAYFPIIDEWTTVPSFVIGYHAELAALLKDQEVRQAADDESFTYQNVGPHIYIRGGSQRGSLYGVMSFLEREFGVRWYTPSVSQVPKRRRFVFDYLRHSESPGIRVRNDFYYEAFDPLWAARNRVNGAMTYREQPGGVEAYWSVHTFYHFMPPGEFYDSHPDYYSLVDGRHIHERAQLCLTHPDVLNIVTDRLSKTMREHPEYLIYSVSQNDWGNPCQCDRCQAIVKAEGSEAGPVIWFVNQVAERIEPEFPDKFVGTLAYTYTRRPMRHIKPRHNVVIRLCSIECCFAHDFKSCPENASFLRDLQGWADSAQHLYIWDYVVNFSHYILPYPNFGVLQSNIQTFRENNAIGIMEQAAYQSRGGEFAELRAYLLAKLLWNPDADVETIINDFMFGYYGRSGQYVKAYFDLLHHQVTRKTHIHLGLKPEDKLFTNKFIQQADVLFDQAEIVAESDEIRERVEMARLPLMYLKINRSPVLSKEDGTYSRFCEIVAREGITHFAERGAPHVEAFFRFVEDAR